MTIITPRKEIFASVGRTVVSDEPSKLRAAYIFMTVVVLCIAAGFAAGAGYTTVGLGVLVAVIGLVVLIEHPLIRVVILASLVPALSGLNRGIPVPGLRLSEVLIVGIAGITLATMKSAPWGRFAFVALAYVLCTFFFGLYDLSVRGVGLSLEDFGKLIGPVEFLILYRIVLVYAKDVKARQVIVRWVLLASAPIAFLALLQSLNVLGTRALATSFAGQTDSLEPFHSGYRAPGLFAQGHLLGSYLMVSILVGAVFLFDAKRAPMQRRIILGILIIDGLGMGATATATPIIGVIAGVLTLAYWYRQLSRVIFALGLAVTFAVLIFGSTISSRYNQEFTSESTHYGQSIGNSLIPSSVVFRWEVWTHEYIPTIEEHLVTGYGPDLPPNPIWKFTESAYISLLLRGGVPLVLLFGWLMWLAARRSLAVQDDRQPVARVMVVLVAILVVIQIQDNYFLDAGFPQLWWVLAGLLFAQNSNMRNLSTARRSGSIDYKTLPSARVLVGDR
jgi:hypothetical protein